MCPSAWWAVPAAAKALGKDVYKRQEKEFDGEGFAKKGVILVSINYRVNVFGFFAHPELEKENTEGVSGNYGLLDQALSLIHIWGRAYAQRVQ